MTLQSSTKVSPRISLLIPKPLVGPPCSIPSNNLHSWYTWIISVHSRTTTDRKLRSFHFVICMRYTPLLTLMLLSLLIVNYSRIKVMNFINARTTNTHSKIIIFQIQFNSVNKQNTKTNQLDKFRANSQSKLRRWRRITHYLHILTPTAIIQILDELKKPIGWNMKSLLYIFQAIKLNHVSTINNNWSLIKVAQFLDSRNSFINHVDTFTWTEYFGDNQERPRPALGFTSNSFRVIKLNNDLRLTAKAIDLRGDNLYQK